MITAIKDNRSRGKVGDFLKDNLKDDSRLSFVSAYFTIYAYEKLRDRLHKVDHLNFLYGDPRGVNNADPNKIEKKSFNIVDEKLALGNQLQQRCLAKACSDWIKLSNYRFFHGDFELPVNGANILIYGENGSGKSTMYRALEFLTRKRFDSIAAERNIFSEEGEPLIEFGFNNDKELHYP